jgi:hypothetical protein
MFAFGFGEESARSSHSRFMNHSAFLNPMTASGPLFECLFEIVDCGGHHEFAELAVPCARVDSGAKRRLMAKKAVSAIQRWPYNSLSNRALCA